jgi:hypothetical protein
MTSSNTTKPAPVAGGLFIQAIASHPGLREELLAMDRTCENCEHSVSVQPRCGMCVGPTSPTHNQWKELTHVAGHNGTAPTQTP